ncbi:MAG: exonuclease domain-containing protein [Acidimicrobiales bacterium]
MTLTTQGSFDDLGTSLIEVTFVVVDVETTGGSPATSSLTEVAAARYRGGEMLGTFQTLVRPDQRIPPFISALTGISDAMVQGAPTVEAVLPPLLEFVGGAVLVGHNIRFDLSFLDHALGSAGRDPLANHAVDTLALARRLVRDAVTNCKLSTLATALRLPHQPSHRALADVLATGDLLHALLERAGSFGILGLEELLDLPRLVGHPQAPKLRLTTGLPHAPGVYWFCDAAGHVLYVGHANDLRAGVRSHFSKDRRSPSARLLRQLHTVHHRVCQGGAPAAVEEARLIGNWSPPFNEPEGRRRQTANGRGTRHRQTAPRSAAAGRRATSLSRTPRRRRDRRRARTEAAAGDAGDRRTPVVPEVVEG